MTLFSYFSAYTHATANNKVIISLTPPSSSTTSSDVIRISETDKRGELIRYICDRQTEIITPCSLFDTFYASLMRKWQKISITSTFLIFSGPQLLSHIKPHNQKSLEYFYCWPWRHACLHFHKLYSIYLYHIFFYNIVYTAAPFTSC